MRHLRIPSAPRLAAVLVAGALAAGATAGAAPTHRVEPPQLITGASPVSAACSSAAAQHYNSETEPSLAVSPHDPNTMVATWMQDANVAHPVARSTDGGDSWHTTVPRGLTPCSEGNRAEGVFDPWVSYGADGLLYLSSPAGAQPHPGTGLTGVYNPLSRNIWVHVSDDDGRTWREPVAAGGDDTNGFITDKATITADPFRRGVAYVTWAKISPVGVSTLGFSRTFDGGQTWQESSSPIFFAGSRGVLFGSQIVVDRSNADLILVTGESLAQPGAPARQFIGGTRIYALRSDDFGATWSSPVLLGEAAQFGSLPSVASASNGTTYVTWANVTSEASTVTVSSTSNGGETWRPVDVVSGPRKARIPQIAVDARGAVGLTWWAEGDAMLSAVSLTRGLTWTVRPLTKRLDMGGVPSSNSAGGDPLGDYGGLVGLRAGFVSVASLPHPYAVHGPTDLYAIRFGR